MGIAQEQELDPADRADVIRRLHRGATSLSLSRLLRAIDSVAIMKTSS